jgi:hypothetical protein
MRQVLDLIERRADAFRQLPLFSFMADKRIPPEDRFAFVPFVAHFAMSFADICLLLREEPATSKYQEIINANGVEDSNHWKWYLDDLARLGYDEPIRFTEALRRIWSEETRSVRFLTYRLCAIGSGGSVLRKLLLVHSMEAAASVGIAVAAGAAAEWAAHHAGDELTYFGSHHVDSERAHSHKQDRFQQEVAGIPLDQAAREEYCRMVTEVFDAFTDFAEELARFQRGSALSGPPANIGTFVTGSP